MTEEGTLLVDLLGATGNDPPGEADLDFYMWGWVGDVDPMSLLPDLHVRAARRLKRQLLLQPALSTSCSSSSRRAADRRVERKAMHHRDAGDLLSRAPYHVLYYDSELHAYRTDRFGGWENQPPETRHAAVRVRPDRLHEAHRGVGRPLPAPRRRRAACRVARRRRRAIRGAGLAAGRPPPTTRRSSWEPGAVVVALAGRPRA